MDGLATIHQPYGGQDHIFATSSVHYSRIAAHLLYRLTQTTGAASQYFDISLARVKLAFEWLRTRNFLYAGIDWSEETAALWMDASARNISTSEAPDGIADWGERPIYISQQPDDQDTDSEEAEELPVDRSGGTDANVLGTRLNDRVSSAIQAIIEPTAEHRSVAPLLGIDPTLLPSAFPGL